METPESQTTNSDTEKRIALWPGRNREDGTKPYLTGKLTLDGKTFFVSLWKRDRVSSREPLFSGNIELSTDEELEI